MAEGTEIGIDQPRETPGERGAIDAELGRHVGAQIVDEDVGRADAFDQRLAFSLVAEIAGDRFLAAVERNEAHAVALDEGRAPFARIVALGPLDLDYLRTEEGQ